MARYNTLKELFIDICNAVREQNQNDEIINHADLPNRILTCGSGAAEVGYIPLTTSLGEFSPPAARIGEVILTSSTLFKSTCTKNDFICNYNINSVTFKSSFYSCSFDNKTGYFQIAIDFGDEVFIDKKDFYIQAKSSAFLNNNGDSNTAVSLVLEMSMDELMKISKEQMTLLSYSGQFIPRTPTVFNNITLLPCLNIYNYSSLCDLRYQLYKELSSNLSSISFSEYIYEKVINISTEPVLKYKIQAGTDPTTKMETSSVFDFIDIDFYFLPNKDIYIHINYIAPDKLDSGIDFKLIPSTILTKNKKDYSFYAQDYMGANWDIRAEKYDLSHHNSNVEVIPNIQNLTWQEWLDLDLSSHEDITTDTTVYNYSHCIYVPTFDLDSCNRSTAFYNGYFYFSTGETGNSTSYSNYLRMYHNNTGASITKKYVYGTISDHNNMKVCKIFSPYDSIEGSYELYLFENGDMFLKILQRGTNYRSTTYFRINGSNRTINTSDLLSIYKLGQNNYTTNYEVYNFDYSR